MQRHPFFDADGDVVKEHRVMTYGPDKAYGVAGGISLFELILVMQSRGEDKVATLQQSEIGRITGLEPGRPFGLVDMDHRCPAKCNDPLVIVMIGQLISNCPIDVAVTIGISIIDGIDPV